MNLRFVVLVLTIFILSGCQKDKSSPERIKDLPGDPGPFIESPASTDIGNGGDLIQCLPRLPNFPYPHIEGWYVLDYAENRSLNKEYLNNMKLESHIERLRSLIEYSAPELLDSFKFFMRSVPFINRQAEDQIISSDVERVWVPTEKNEEINDENPSYIAWNCRISGSSSIRLHQVIVRQALFNSSGQVERVEYYYDEDLISKIGNKDLQLSILIFHEWLWDLFPPDKSRMLRLANRELHSLRSQSFSRIKIRRLLNLEAPRPFPPKGRK